MSFNEIKKENNITFGNNSPVVIKGKGFVLLKDKVKAGNFLFVDGSRHNLLSVGRTRDQGNEVVFRSKNCVVWNIDTGTKKEAPTDDEIVTTTSQKVVGEGINEALEERIESTVESEKNPSRYVHKNHPESQILGENEVGVQTRRNIVGTSSHLALLSTIEPQNVNQARKDECWVKVMDEELDQIEKNHTWELVPRPRDKNVIRKKWVFKNKLNENAEVIRNKARLVCKCYAQ
eukprot:PITA_24661